MGCHFLLQGSSWIRDRTHISCLAGGFFTTEPPGKGMKVKVAQSCPSLCGPMHYTAHGILQARILEWIAVPLFQGIFPTQGLNPGLPTLQADSLPTEPPGKPMNSGVGNLSVLQLIFLDQQLNPGLSHCRQILTNWATWEASVNWLHYNKLYIFKHEMCFSQLLRLFSQRHKTDSWERLKKILFFFIYKTQVWIGYINAYPG